MNDSQAEAVLRRLEAIEAAVSELSKRIDVVEGRRRASATATVSHDVREVKQQQVAFDIGAEPNASLPPPPRLQAPEPEPPTAGTPPADPVSPQAVRREIDDFEYKIGLQGLLRGGAAVMVVGLLYLVALAISRSWITLGMQFAGELILAGLFIAIGIWKRNEREEFGQLMVGIGSCGLFLSFTGAHVHKHLISSDMLVVAFVVLSLANLLYSHWRASRSFLVLGLAGGLIASTLPAQEAKVGLSLGLLTLIFTFASLVLVRNRWTGLVPLLWFGALCTLVPSMFVHEAFWLVAGAIYGVSLASALISSYLHTDSEPTDPQGVFPPIAIAVGAALAIVIDWRPINGVLGLVHGSWHVLVLSGATVVGSRLVAMTPEAARRLLAGGVYVGTIFGPSMLTPTQAGLAYAFVAIGLAAFAIRSKLPSLGLAAWAHFALLMLCYLLLPLGSGPAQHAFALEAPLLVSGIVTAAICATASYRTGSDAHSMFMIASLLVAPLFLRIGFAGTGLWAPGDSPGVGLLGAMTILCWVFAAVAAVTNWVGSKAFAWLTLVMSLWVYASLVADRHLRLGLELVFLAALALTIPLTAKSTTKASSSIDAAVAGSGLMLLGPWVRLIFLLMTRPVGTFSNDAALLAGTLSFALVAMLVATRWPSKSPVLLGWLATGIAFCILVYDLPQPSALSVIHWMGVVLGSTIWLGVLSYRHWRFSTTIGWTVLWAWFEVSIWSEYGMDISGNNWTNGAELTSAWIVLGSVLIALGFRWGMRPLRYWALLVFATTLAKVFLFDLVWLDPAVRVVILLALGLAMLAGGYAYIRMRPSVAPNGVDTEPGPPAAEVQLP